MGNFDTWKFALWSNVFSFFLNGFFVMVSGKPLNFICVLLNGACVLWLLKVKEWERG